MRRRSKSEGHEGSAEEEEGKIRRRSERMYRGVRMRKWGRWVSEIRMPNQKGRIWLGSYDSAHKAALAYDLAAFCLRGYAATLNFPNSPPPATALPPEPYSPRRIQTAASSYALLSDNVADDGSKPPAILSSVCWRSSNNRNSSSSSVMSIGYDNVVEVGSPWLPALDTAVLDSLASFLEAHSHTKWWLG